MTDLSRLSDSDLEAIASGDMTKVSDAGLQLIANSGAGSTPSVSKAPNAGRAAVFAGGFNSALGIPMNIAADAADLLTAATGFAGSKLFGMEPPGLLNRERVPFTTQWLAANAPSIFNPPGSEEHKYVRSAGMGAGGAMLGPQSGGMGPAVARAAMGATAAPVGHAVADITGVPEAGMLAATVVPFGVGVGQSAWRNRASVLPFIDTAAQQARQSLKPHTQEEIIAAINLQREAQAAGSPISAAQALKSAPRMVALERKVNESQYAPQSMLHDAQQQPARVQALASRASEAVGVKNYSVPRANQIEAAADATMEMPRKMAGAAVQPIYDMLKQSRPQLPEEVRWSLAAKLHKLNEDVGLLEQSSAGGAVGGVSGTVTRPSIVVDKNGVPFRRAEGGIYELDNYLKELRTRIDRVSSVNPDAKQLVERAGLSPAHSEIRQALVDNSPALAKAKTDYQTIKAIMDSAVRGTGIPDMSRRFNADPTASKTGASWNTLSKLITKQQGPDDLRAAERMLSEQDKSAFADVTSNLLAHQLDAAPNTAAFVKGVRAIPNIETAIELAAKGRGMKNPEKVSRGFMRALDIIEAGTNQRGTIGSSAGQVEQASAGKFGATVAVGHELARKSAILGKIRDRLERMEVETLIRHMDSPRSLENLVALADSQVGSAQFAKTMRSLLTPSDEAGRMALTSMLPIIYQQEQ